MARTQLNHLLAIVIVGMGQFTDAYDFFAISLLIDLIGYQYYYKGQEIPRGVHAALNAIALCGAVPGQLVFGWLGDRMGRRRIYSVTIAHMVAISTLATGLSFSKRVGSNVVTVLCFLRFWLGFSIGGDYLLSATIMSETEYANKRTRGAFIAAVFAMHGFGNLAAGIVGMVVAATFLKMSATPNVDFVGRIVLMIGAVPAIFTYYWRMKMPAVVAKHEKKAAASHMSSVLSVDIVVPDDEAAVVDELASRARQGQYGLFSAEFLRRHGIHLLGTSVCWLVLDITFYSLNLFMKDIFTEVGLLPALQIKESPFRRITKITALHTAITICATLPGYFFAIALVDRIGRVRIQLLGFTMMSIIILCLSVPYNYWKETKNKHGFAVMYAVIFFFANFGPNTTAFIILAEIFPARLHSTCHGIFGAFGNMGAIIGLFGFLKAEKHVRIMLFALVGCNLVGLLFTLLLPESKGKALEEITGEMEEQQPEQDSTGVAAAE